MDNLILFFDGCHKIYYADRNDIVTTDQMRRYGYNIIEGDFGNNLRQLWADACSLRFVEPADFDNQKPQVGQFETDGLRGFIDKLRVYYEGAASSQGCPALEGRA